MLDDWTERDTIVFAAMTPFCTAGTPLTNLIVAHSVIEARRRPGPVPVPLQLPARARRAPGADDGVSGTTAGPMSRHGRETRQRIYCPKLMTELRRVAATYHLTTFGGVDPMWHGAQIHDHSLASLVLEKSPVIRSPLALSRTCALADDFPHCLSVAEWQQQLADEAWARWLDTFHVRTRDHSLCVNWSGCNFIAPGVEADTGYAVRIRTTTGTAGRCPPRACRPSTA